MLGRPTKRAARAAKDGSQWQVRSTQPLEQVYKIVRAPQGARRRFKRARWATVLREFQLMSCNLFVVAAFVVIALFILPCTTFAQNTNQQPPSSTQQQQPPAGTSTQGQQQPGAPPP